jgi:hypothetical protein
MAALIEQIVIQSISRFEVFKSLEEISLNKKPYFLDLQVFKTEEVKVLSYIEQYLINIDAHKFPYSLYVKTNQSFQTKLFRIVSDFQQCPTFFRRKSKLLSVKEQKLQDRIDLKLKKLLNLGLKDKEIIIKSYAAHHKKLYALVDEGTKLENIFELIMESEN